METKRNQYGQEVRRTYYPTIAMTELHQIIEVGTFVRLEHKGIWYDVKVRKTHEYSTTSPVDMNKVRAELLEVFHKEVYFAQKLYIIDLTLLDKEGEYLHTPSKWCQTSEQDRLKEYYKVGV